MSDAQHAPNWQPTPGTDLTTAIATVLRAHLHRKEDWVDRQTLARRADRDAADLAVAQRTQIDCLQWQWQDDDIVLRIRPEDRDRLATQLLRGGGHDG